MMKSLAIGGKTLPTVFFGIAVIVSIAAISFLLHSSDQSEKSSKLAIDKSLTDLQISDAENDSAGEENRDDSLQPDSQSEPDQLVLSEWVVSAPLEEIASQDALLSSCGVDADRAELNLNALRKLTSSERGTLFPKQNDAIRALKVLCERWHQNLDWDSATKQAAEENEELNSELQLELARLYAGSTRWNPAYRDLAFEALSSGDFTATMLALMMLFEYDLGIHEILADSIKTTDMRYVKASQPYVGILAACRLEGNCSRKGLASISVCITDATYCDGITSGIINSVSFGQFEDIDIMSQTLIAMARGDFDWSRVP